MTALLDTSVVVRYLKGDPPGLAQAAAVIIDSDEELLLSGVVVAETAYVLMDVYETPRADVVDALISLVQKENIRPWEFDKAGMMRALLLCRPSNRVSFADAMVWAAASTTHSRAVYTFDARFPSDGIVVRRPSAPS